MIINPVYVWSVPRAGGALPAVVCSDCFPSGEFLGLALVPLAPASWGLACDLCGGWFPAAPVASAPVRAPWSAERVAALRDEVAADMVAALEDARDNLAAWEIIARQSSAALTAAAAVEQAAFEAFAAGRGEPSLFVDAAESLSALEGARDVAAFDRASLVGARELLRDTVAAAAAFPDACTGGAL